MRKRQVSGQGSWDMVFDLKFVPNYKLISVLFEPHSSDSKKSGVEGRGELVYMTQQSTALWEQMGTQLWILKARVQSQLPHLLAV